MTETNIENRITAVAGEERAAALGVAPAPATPPTVAELKAKAQTERDAKALAAYTEYASFDNDRFARARAMTRLGADLIARGYELAQPAKKD